VHTINANQQDVADLALFSRSLRNRGLYHSRSQNNNGDKSL
jgi:hypothetical protein